jgi:hypothetical protein
MVTVWVAVTGRWVTVNDAEIFPGAIRTEAGTVTAFTLELDSATVSPAAGAGPVK